MEANFLFHYGVFNYRVDVVMECINCHRLEYTWQTNSKRDEFSFCKGL